MSDNTVLMLLGNKSDAYGLATEIYEGYRVNTLAGVSEGKSFSQPITLEMLRAILDQIPSHALEAIRNEERVIDIENNKSRATRNGDKERLTVRCLGGKDLISAVEDEKGKDRLRGVLADGIAAIQEGPDEQSILAELNRRLVIRMWKWLRGETAYLFDIPRPSQWENQDSNAILDTPAVCLGLAIDALWKFAK